MYIPTLEDQTPAIILLLLGIVIITILGRKIIKYLEDVEDGKK